MHTVTKQYRDLPAGHRAPGHGGHCQYLHGHNFGFDITFTAAQLDECDFVIDVGQLQAVKKFLGEAFDHTLLINADDPLRDEIIRNIGKISQIRLVESCGMEGLAKMVFENVEKILDEDFPGSVERRGLRVVSVTCFEDSKNSSTYSK